MPDQQAAVVLNYIQLALAGLCTLTLVFRALALARFRPYFCAIIAAIAYLLVPVLLLVGDDVSYIFGIYFLSAAVTPMLWLNVFDSIYAASTGKEGKKLTSCNLFGVQLGYLWTLVMVLCAVGVCATLGNFYNGGAQFSPGATQGAVYFLAYGQWVYVFLAIVQLASDKSDVQHFSRSLSAYIFLLVVVNIGVTMDAAVAASSSQPDNGMPIAILILSRYFGLFAIFIILLYGHNWCRSQNFVKDVDSSRDLEESRA